MTPTGSGPIEITLTWTPQRTLWIAIALSALALAGCIALLVVTTVRRRRGAEPSDEGAGPELADWRTYGGSTPGPTTLAVVSVVTAVVMAFAAGWLVGLISGAAVAAGSWWPRLRPVLIALSPAALGGAALFILAKQLRYSLEPSFEWPTYFDKVHVLGWLAVAVLLCDLVIRETRARVVARARHTRGIIHRVVLFLPTGRESYDRRMTYEVTLADETTERIDDADAYQLEGPLTTFFRTTPGRAVVDCWSTRLASYRTADIRRIRMT